LQRKKSSVLKPKRSATASEGIDLLKRGLSLQKFSDSESGGNLRSIVLKLDDDEKSLSWEGRRLGKLLDRGAELLRNRGDSSQRKVLVSAILSLHVGGDDGEVHDHLALERTAGFGNGRASVRRPAAALPDSSRLKLSLKLIGSLPAPPMLDMSDDVGDARAPSARPPRAYLRLLCADEVSHALCLAGLRCLVNELLPPSPIGPEALSGSFGAPLAHVALADASIHPRVDAGSRPLLVPAVLEACWLPLVRRGSDGLGTEGVFRLSAAESELAEMRRRIQEGDGIDEAFSECSSICLAALIKSFLRDLPTALWDPVRGQVIELLGGAPGGGGAGSGGTLTSANVPATVAAATATTTTTTTATTTTATDEAHHGASEPAGAAAGPTVESERMAPESLPRSSATPASGFGGGSAPAAGPVALGFGLLALVGQLPRRSADLVVWVCHVMSAVVDREVETRMGCSAIAAVMAPVLMRGALVAEEAQDEVGMQPAEVATNPLEAMRVAQLSVALAEALLKAHRHQADVEQADGPQAGRQAGRQAPHMHGA
jgi:hypothetical protein